MNRNVLSGLVCAALGALSLPAFSMNAQIDDGCMSQISMHFTAEHWVSSETSQVSVSISASVPEAEVNAITDAIKTKLTALSKVKDWRLVNLTREESASGLIVITGHAVARLNNNQLSALQAQLKTLNKPGEKYSMDGVDSKPSLETLNQARTALRADLYKQIINGQQELNAALPDAKGAYHIHAIHFNDARMPEPVAYAAANVRALKKNYQDQDSSLSGKMQMSAVVTYGAIPPYCKPKN